MEKGGGRVLQDNIITRDNRLPLDRDETFCARNKSFTRDEVQVSSEAPVCPHLSGHTSTITPYKVKYKLL